MAGLRTSRIAIINIKIVFNRYNRRIHTDKIPSFFFLIVCLYFDAPIRWELPWMDSIFDLFRTRLDNTTFLRDLNIDASQYDLIATGDLGRVGHHIAGDLLKKHGMDIPDERLTDCGILIYRDDQPVFADGSGCACAATTTYGHFISRMKRGELKRILVIATGALLSPMSYQQKETIPCIAHAVSLSM